VEIGQTITKEQADQILASDLTKVEKDVERLVKVPLNQNQFDALVSFHFNTGALGRSSLLKKLNAGDYQGAADGLMAWVNAKQIGPGPIPGLVRRRTDERNMFLSKPTQVGHHAGAGAVIVAGGAAASQAPHHLIPWIIGGTLLVALITWFIIKKG
jgi:lysozyme